MVGDFRMKNFMRERFQERLDALGMNAFEAANAASLNRYIVFDLLEGKKDTIRLKAIPQLAQVLQCDPEYLIGAQATPVRVEGIEPQGKVLAPPSVPLAGICEAGVWRRRGASVLSSDPPIPPDHRYDASRQVAYLARGDGAEPLGVKDGDALVALTGEQVRDGDLVIARRSKRGAGEEISARRVAGSKLATGSRNSPDLDLSETEIIGRIISAHRLY